MRPESGIQSPDSGILKPDALFGTKSAILFFQCTCCHAVVFRLKIDGNVRSDSRILHGLQNSVADGL
jgi:hypothetical protein